uniref:Transmembrane protein n=1 Tax=Hydatigena taeniaeformis TaxID=6205 RepID=A0A0R3WYY8_HYDTA
LSLQFSIWLIVLLSLTSLFAIWFILCGLFRRADAYRTPNAGLSGGGCAFGDLDGAAFGEGGRSGSLFGGMNFDGDV